MLNLTSHSFSIASGPLLFFSFFFLFHRLHYSSICALLKGRMFIKGCQHSGANDSACEYAAGEIGYDHQEGVKKYEKAALSGIKLTTYWNKLITLKFKSRREKRNGVYYCVTWMVVRSSCWRYSNAAKRTVAIKLKCLIHDISWRSIQTISSLP